MGTTQLDLNDVELLALKKEDAKALAELANDKTIFDNVRDYFPYPYSIEDARSFISGKLGEFPQTTFGIRYRGELSGMIDVKLQTDVYRKSAEIGYWIGMDYRGKGIATTAVQLITSYGIKTLGLNRLYAGVFSSNPASMTVLKKCGYLLEGISKKAVWKNGQFLDLHQYAYVENTDY